ncbi:MAG: hypothetical protein ACFE9Z_02660 [Promethearchaeota archaeon]
MTKSKVKLCEVIFRDPKLGILTSKIGTINDSQLHFNLKDLDKFIIFNEKYISPILKSDIQQILVYQDDPKINNKQEISKVYSHSITKVPGKIS